MNDASNSRRIKILRDTVALRIAAGEVIDRPFSVVRELMDNAIDSAATSIDLYIENGGIDRIRVVDNGYGMDPEDLKLCFLPHSTSKIQELEDLDNLDTLGFRGEALSSIAACSKLEIISSTAEGVPHRIVVNNGRLEDFSPFRGNKGTVVSVSGLFHEMPARRRFLKRPASEASACKKTFLEKALPFHTRSFRYYQDGELKLFFPESSLKNRILHAYKGVLNEDLIHEAKAESKDLSLTVIAADPSFTRKDRRFIQIFLNNRRITDFSLIQAVEYGFSEYLPGGTFPVAFLFIKINPSLVDFNIHPAKKEVRIRNTSELHHETVKLIKKLMEQFSYNFRKSVSTTGAHSGFTEFKFKDDGNQEGYSDVRENRYAPARIAPAAADRMPDYKVLDNSPFPKPEAGVKEEPFMYLGQVFNLFLIISAADNIYFIDQHAAHERILFNKFLENTSSVQELLIPRIFNVDEDVHDIIRGNIEEYRRAGIILEELADSQWSLNGVPENCTGLEEIIVEFIKSQRGTVKDLKTALYADMACKSAVKDGEVMDYASAVELIRKTLELENARCPHGRPVWFQISKDELFKLVGRT